MGRINVRVDEDLLDEVDSHGDVRSEVVREALKQYLGVGVDADVDADDREELADVVESVVDRKIQRDVYPRLGNIYDRLDEEVEREAEDVPVELRLELDPEVYEFYENYTKAFGTSLSDLVSNMLTDEVSRISEEARGMPYVDPEWARGK